MARIRQFLKWVTDLFPTFHWEELTPCQCIGLDLDPKQTWEGLHVEWSDGTGFILTARVVR